MQMLLGALVVAIVTGSLPGRAQAAPTPGLSDGAPQRGFAAAPATSVPAPASSKRDRSGLPSGTVSPQSQIRPAIDRPGVSGRRDPADWMDEIYPVWARLRGATTGIPVELVGELAIAWRDSERSA